jgi:hypothetical protein
MAKSKHSEEDILKLGKRLVQELMSETTTKTLGRWMAHYVAELIHKAEHCESEEEKKVAQRECCDLILKLWREREYSPTNSKPLSELKPLIALLEVFKKEDFPFPSFPSWMKRTETETTWSSFLKLVKDNSSDIIKLCFYTSVSKETLKKEQAWVKDHENMLSKEELTMINNLEVIVAGGESVLRIFMEQDTTTPPLSEFSPIERFEAVFGVMEAKLEEQRAALVLLKESVMKDLNK